MIYLDNSATSRFKPVKALNTLYRTAAHSSNPGRGGHSDSLSAGLSVYNTRKVLCEYVKADNNFQCIFTDNCTGALNIAIQGLNPKHMIVDAFSHNSVLRTCNLLCKKGSSMTIIQNLDESSVRKAIVKDTELIAVNHMSNVNGRIADYVSVGKIAREYGVPMLLDTAQSLGHINVDVRNNVAMLAGAGHKGLHGIQGVGFLILNNEITLNPIIVGGTGTMSDSLDQPTELPEALESGTLNTPSICALKDSVEWTKNNRLLIDSHYAKLSKLAHSGLSNIGKVKLYSQYPSPIIAFNVADCHSSEIADYLNECGIAVRSGLHCAPLAHKTLNTTEQGIVRASIGMNNTENDIIALLKAVRQYVSANL